MYLENVSIMKGTVAVYTRCKVKVTASRGAMGKVYSEEYLALLVEDTHILCIQTVADEIDVGFRIKSAQVFNASFPCLALFEHPEFKGFSYATAISLDDITETFPRNTAGGLSGAYRLQRDVSRHRGCSTERLNSLKVVIKGSQSNLSSTSTKVETEQQLNISSFRPCSVELS